jgi:mRNA-degrading endonuclease RelE of RelBE toxin-antitoxin system
VLSLAAVRVGDYRIIYDVDETARAVTVAVVGHRREVYRGLDH